MRTDIADPTDGEILRLRRENRKLQDATIYNHAVANFGGFSEGLDYFENFQELSDRSGPLDESNPLTWSKQDWLNNARLELRAKDREAAYEIIETEARMVRLGNREIRVTVHWLEEAIALLEEANYGDES